MQKTGLLYLLILITCHAMAQDTGKDAALQIIPKDSLIIGQHTAKGVLSVYPDVATGNLNVLWESQPKETANVVIIDTADIEILETTIKISTPSGQTKIDLSSLKQGEYTIFINADKISFTGKLIVLP